MALLSFLIALLLLPMGPTAKVYALTKFAFTTGEKLYYRAHWNGVTGGYAMVEVIDHLDTKQGEIFRFKMKAKTSKFIDIIYKVRNRISNQWNATQRRPMKVDKFLIEGYTKRYYKMTFDYKNMRVDNWLKLFAGNGKVFGTKRKNAKWHEQKGSYHKLLPSTQDYLSALYFMRSDKRKPQEGSSFQIHIYDNLRYRNVNFKILKKETIKTVVGSFAAVKISTDFKTEGHLRSKGRMLVWVSDDKFRYPLRATAQIPVFGKVEVELVKIVKGQ